MQVDTLLEKAILKVRMQKLCLLMSDICALLISGVLSVVLASWASEQRGEWLQSQDTNRFTSWLGICFIGISLFLIKLRHYSDRKPFWTELREILNILLVLALLDLALVAFAQWNASRLWWALVWLFSIILLPSARFQVRRILLKFGLWKQPTLLIGSGSNALEALNALESEPGIGFEIIGLLEIPESLDKKRINTIPLLNIEQVESMSKTVGMHFVIALENYQNQICENWIRNLIRWGAQDITVIPALRGIPLFGTNISYFYSHEVAMLKLQNNLRHFPARVIKRLFDLLLSLIILSILWPLFIYLALLIRKDGGDAFFAHKRVGLNGRKFNCYKFRSMQVDAALQLRKMLVTDPQIGKEWVEKSKLKNDPRITNIGYFLRRNSLDELPQLFNVLLGDMSLVGPRPVIQEELIRYGENIEYYLMVRPGITGLWQVSGRNNLDYEKRVYLDTWYVKNWSLWYDIAILFKTIRVVIRQDGAI
jgi:Undecaprenyl-phosphate galactose phosphotransferase WbaP